MDALQEGVEVQAGGGGDHHLAVEDAPLRQLRPQRVEQLREVPGKGPLVAAAQLHLVTVTEQDATKTVPLRLEEHAGPSRRGGRRQLPDELGQHGGHRRHDGEVHARSLPYR